MSAKKIFIWAKIVVFQTVVNGRNRAVVKKGLSIGIWKCRVDRVAIDLVRDTDMGKGRKESIEEKKERHL